MSYFNEAAIRFRERFGISEKGINVFCSQFIGRLGKFLLGGEQRQALAPFLSAVVKTTLVSGTREGLIRFEYGLGSGALVGRTILVHDTHAETLSGKHRLCGVHADLMHTGAEVLVLPHAAVEKIEPSNSSVLNILLASAYPKIMGPVAEAARRMLELLVSEIHRYQELNHGPLYLELVSSSFRSTPIFWFVVQASDFTPMNPIPRPPGDVDFSSNKDFCGHGMIQGKKNVYIFGETLFNVQDVNKPSQGMLILEDLTKRDSDFVVIVPQQALSGTNLTSVNNRHYLSAAVVIEYERLHQHDSPRKAHTSGPSSEHFEQLMLDFERLFIPVDCPFPQGLAFGVGSDDVVRVMADVTLACDRERGIAWGKVENIKFVGSVYSKP
jgi:hypothetical protein